MFTLAVAHAQTLTAPQRAVFAHADTVERHRDHLATVKRPVVFGKAGGNVGMMMQHLMLRQRQFRRPLRRAIGRVVIRHHRLRRKVVNGLHQRQRLPPLGFHAVVGQVAKVLAEYRPVAAHQAEGIFHVRAEAEHRRYIAKARRQGQCIRHIAARTAQHLTALAHHRIVHALHDIAVVQQEAVGNIGQIGQCIIVGQRRWLTAQITGGHHQRARQRLH